MRLISTTATTASSTPDQDRSDRVRNRRTGQLVGGQTGRRDDQADQGGGVLGEHRPQSGIGGGQHVLDQVPLHATRPRVWPARTDCRNEIPSRTNDTASTTYPTAKWLAGSGWMSSWMPCVTDTAAPSHEQPDRGEQRPHVRLPAVAERVRGVGRAAGPPVGDQQEDLVAGVRPRMRRLGQQ